VLCAPELFTLIFPGSYSSGVVPFQCFTLITLHRVTEYGVVLRAADKQRLMVRASAVLLIANAVFATGGALIWGTVGVAIGCLAAFALAWLYTLTLLAGVFELPWGRVFPWRAWTASLTLAAVAALAATAAAANVGPVVLRLATKVAVFGTLVVGVQRSGWLKRLADRPGPLWAGSPS
jgi:O-antigen/teichoic acid export membrane protein